MRLCLLSVAVLGLCPALAGVSRPDGFFRPGTVTVDGEIGRRMEITLEKMLKHTDIERTFVRHFRTRREKNDELGGFAGYGMPTNIDNYVPWCFGGIVVEPGATGYSMTINRKTVIVFPNGFDIAGSYQLCSGTLNAPARPFTATVVVDGVSQRRKISVGGNCVSCSDPDGMSIFIR